MIPIRDDNPTRTFPFITIILIVMNTLAFFYELSLQSQPRVEAFFADFALVPAEITQMPSLGALRTVFTSMFLHGGWLHLIGNMWFLWIFGNNIEDSVGHFKFIFFYLLCGIAAAAAQILSVPDSSVPMIGASGAISGVLGAYLLLFPRARVLVLFPIWIFFRFIYVPAWLMLIVWFAMQLLSGWATAGAAAHGGGVAFWAHVGGFVAGLALIPLFKKRYVRLLQ
jgi:membrane associated rhomboid family serine protease